MLIEVYEQGEFAALSPEDKERVLDFIRDNILTRREALNDYTNVPELDEKTGALYIDEGDVSPVDIEDSFICHRCEACDWVSGESGTGIDEDTEMLEHVMAHLGLLGGQQHET